MSDETEIEKTLRLIFDSMPAQVVAAEFLRKLEAAGCVIIRPQMTDGIRKVIASALQDARHEGQRIRFSDGYAYAMTEAALTAIHTAGYEITPKQQGASDDG